MKRKSLLLKAIFPFLVLALLGACSRLIEGDVFLDKNANNVKDAGEEVISGIPFTVTKDNANFKNGTTDPTGHYSIVMANGQTDGNYCVQISDKDIAAIDATRLANSKALQAVAATPEPTSQACPLNGAGRPDCNDKNCCDNALCAEATICKDQASNACSKTSDGKPDCTDSDCCDQSECSSADACKSKTDANACPKDKSGAAQCSDSRCADDPSCHTLTVKSRQACDKSKSTSMTLTLDVPVAVDYSTRVAKISKTLDAPANAGDKVGIEVTYPSSCTFDPYNLPSAFLPLGLGDAYNATTHELSLSKAVADKPSQLIGQDSPPFGHDALFTYLLVLEVVGDDSLQDSDVTIQPTLTCPDGKKVSASATLIHLKASKSYSLSSEISPKCPNVGETATISASVESHAAKGFADAIYTLSIGGESHITLGALPSECKDKGSSIECDLSGFAGTKADLSFPVTLEDTPAAFTFSPKLVVDGIQFTDSVISCNNP